MNARVPPRFCRSAVSAALFGLSALSVAQAAPPLRAERLRVGFLESAFRHMNRNDAQAAFKVFAQTLGRKRGYQLDADVNVYASAEDLLAAGQNGAVDAAWCDAWIYAGSRTGDRLQPAYFSTWDQGHVERTYKLLVRRDGPVGALADLRGRSVIGLSIVATDTSQRWLEAVLLTNGLGRSASFLGHLEEVSRASAAVLPVFFGQKDACLVDEAGFSLMRDLNPQVGAGLREIASSGPLVGSVICLATNGWSSVEFERDLRDALNDLHADADGRQILTLFKCGRLLPYEARRLDSLRYLRKTLDEPESAVPNAVGGTAP